MTTILVPTDGSNAAEKALGVAMDLAEAHKADIRLLHVLLTDKEPGELLRVADIAAGDALADRLAALAEGPDASRSVEDLMSNPNLPTHPVPADVLRQIGTRILERARRQVAARGLPAGVLDIADGPAAPAIAAAAETEGAEMIVMGMRGLRIIDAFTYGSVSQQVCGTVKCTCIAVH